MAYNTPLGATKLKQTAPATDTGSDGK